MTHREHIGHIVHIGEIGHIQVEERTEEDSREMTDWLQREMRRNRQTLGQKREGEREEAKEHREPATKKKQGLEQK
jgi:hypothetical protein